MRPYHDWMKGIGNRAGYSSSVWLSKNNLFRLIFQRSQDMHTNILLRAHRLLFLAKGDTVVSKLEIKFAILQASP